MAITLRKGDKGDNVKALQKALGVNADGDFGPKTEEAVKAFQKSKGLAVDGIVGAQTLKALGLSLPEQQSNGLNIVSAPLTRHITPKSRVPKYIAIHYTAGTTSAKGAAMATRNGWQNGNRDASADFVVDDETIVQASPDLNKYVCWSVGDNGGGKYIKNTNSISIEICSNLKKGYSAKYPNHDGWYFTEKELENAAKLTKYLMNKFNIPLENVVRHFDVTKKLCPGIVGWNDGQILNQNTGASMGVKNNSEKWLNFKARLK